MLDEASWAYFGLVGGGMYLYFAGRGIALRVSMQRRGVRVGTPETLRTAYVASAIWGGVTLVTIALAVADLRAS